MDRKFWLQRWADNQIGFHQPAYNPWLLKYWPSLGIAPDSVAFLPLCGKTLDLRWLAEQGHDVVGIELSHIAIEAFFAEAGESFNVDGRPDLPCYQGRSARIYCGDFFELTAEDLHGVRAVFDRAALVALPPELRRRYADHLLRVLPADVRILLVTFEYDQKLVAGPPFSVHDDEIEALYGERCDIELLDCGCTTNVPPHFETHGVTTFAERVYRLIKRS